MEFYLPSYPYKEVILAANDNASACCFSNNWNIQEKK